MARINKKRLGYVLGLVAIGLACGQFVQQSQPQTEIALDGLQSAPKEVTPVAATDVATSPSSAPAKSDFVKSPILPAASTAALATGTGGGGAAAGTAPTTASGGGTQVSGGATGADAAPLAPTDQAEVAQQVDPAAPAAAATAPATAPTALAEAPAPAPSPAPEPAPQLAMATTEPAEPAPAQVSQDLAAPAAPTLPQPDAPAPLTELATGCEPSLDLFSDDRAMIGITLIAPCGGAQAITIRHAGLTIPAQTSDTGAYFSFLPAMEQSALVDVTLADGTQLEKAIEVPELSQMRRLAIVWQEPDAFAIRALENGDDYTPDNGVSAENPQVPPAGVLPVDGYLVAFGAAEGAESMRAEIYTYPANPMVEPEVLIELPVTATTCGRPLIGKTIYSQAGKAESRDLDVQTPECGGPDSFLVLNNPASDMNIAASN